MTPFNVILITIDTLRADRVGAYGCPRPLTPHLDRLAARSIRFDRAITGGSWTQAAFPTLLTSTYASMYGGCLGPLAPERPSGVEQFAANRYTTGGFSTSPLLSRAYGYDRGFHHFADLVPESSQPFLYRFKGGQRLLRQQLTHRVGQLLGRNLRPARVYLSAEEVNQHLFGWLERCHDPFFLWAHYMDVHWPYHLDATLTRPARITQMWRDVAHLHDVNWNAATMTRAQRDHYIQLYEQAVRYTDEQVGALIRYLEGSGRLEQTIVAIVSDHGEEFLEHGHWGHVETNLYDEILRVPFILYHPALEGGVVRQQVSTLDLMPMLLDLCRIPVPAEMLGRSLQDIEAQGVPAGEAPPAISERWRDDAHIIALRTRHQKYIWHEDRPDRPELYDLQVDPGETVNVINEHAASRARFQAMVDTHLDRVRSSVPATATTDVDLDRDVMERLRDLGYVE